ncbi:vitamin K epoxide reductase family protein [Acidobacteriota bacterium]
MFRERRGWLVLVFVLIGLGLLISGYLTYRSLVLLSSSAPSSQDFCSVVIGISCDDTLLSPSSWFLGIPVAGFGVVYYLALIVLFVLGGTLKDAFEQEAKMGTLILSVFGALGSLFLAVTILAKWVPFCPLCLVIHTINLILVFSLWKFAGLPFKAVLTSVRSAISYIVTGKTESPREARWKFLGFFMVVLIVVLVFQWIYVQANLRKAWADEDFSPDQVLSEYSIAIEQDLEITPDDPHLGNFNAPVKLVVFSNFECPGCRNFVSDLHYLANQYGEGLVIIFKHFPIDAACNPLISQSPGSMACEAAWSAEASRQQGLFWPYHDMLFASGLGSDKELFTRIALENGLDLDRFTTDRQSTYTIAKIKKDVDLAIRLGVDGTPGVFMNGKQVRNRSIQALQLLINQQLSPGK